MISRLKTCALPISFLAGAMALSCRGAEPARPGEMPGDRDDDPRGGSGGQAGASGPRGAGGATNAGGAPARDAASASPDALEATDAAMAGGRDVAASMRADARDGAGAAPDVATVPASASCAGIAVCDDFEGHAVGAAPAGMWKTTISSGRLSVETTRSWSGAKAVRVNVDARSGARSLLRLTMPELPIATNNMHGRAMFWLAAVPPGRLHWFNVIAVGRLPSGSSAQYIVGGQGNVFILNYFPGDCWRNSPVQFPAGRWACLQWQFDGSKNADGTLKNEMRAWLDGATIGTVVKTGAGCIMAPGRSEWVAPIFDELRLGWDRGGSTPIEMWMDDVAIDSKPVPCVAKP